MKKNQHYFKKVFAAYSMLLFSTVLALLLFIILFSFRTELFASTGQIIPILLFGCLILLIGLLLVYWIAKRLTQPLLNLNRAVENVSPNDRSLSLPDPQGIKEIDELSHSFEKMFLQMKQTRANEERAGYLALSAQMNPHTLYNTVSMIESVSYLNGDKEVSSLCISLCDMMRYITDYTPRSYTVQDELQYLNCYTTLTCKRYEGRLFIKTSCVPQLERRIIPKFTIQPLVENSVKHGFSSAVAQLDILVTVKETAAVWYILVQDNGRGFDEKAIQELYQQFENCDRCLSEGEDFANQKIGNLALCNLYIRCRLMWREAFSITLGNREDCPGAFVKLSFQKSQKEDLPE